MTKIRKLIQNGQIETVLSALAQNTFNKSVSNDATLLLSRFIKLKQEVNSGILNHQESNIESNKITLALLDLVENFEAKGFTIDEKFNLIPNQKSYGLEPPTNDAQPLSASRYVWISVFALILSITLFIGLAYFQQSLTQTLGERGFYLILFPLAFSTAAFLFGVMRSYAIQKGMALSQSVSLGGPIVAALLVIVGGFVLPQNDKTFTLTAFLHGEKGPFDVLVENKGELILDLGAERKPASITNKGEVNFKNIPAQYRDSKIKLGLSNLEDFELINADSLYDLKNPIIYVPIQYKTKSMLISGNVMDEKGNKLLGDVMVSVNNQIVFTDINGLYSLTVPLDQKADDYLVTFRKDGYETKQQRCAATITCDCRLKFRKK